MLLAHLRQGSIKVVEGAWVAPGQVVAACGNSGRSPQPHLHLHLQADAVLGSPTLPFHLVGVVRRSGPDHPPWFYLVLRPREKDLLRLVPSDPKLAKAMHLPVGRCLNYRFRRDREPFRTWQLRVALDLAGQFQLVSSDGGRVSFEEHPGMLAFFDRDETSDLPLDLWTLAVGLTPLTERQTAWSDRPPARLLPLNRLQRLFINLRYPLGGSLESRYQRDWMADEGEERGFWRQRASHVLPLPRRNGWRLESTVEITPADGCTRLEMSFDGHTWELQLESTGLSADGGIPSWDRGVDRFGARTEQLD